MKYEEKTYYVNILKSAYHNEPFALSICFKNEDAALAFCKDDIHYIKTISFTVER